MTPVYLSLGSNVGNSQRHIKNAIELMSKSINNIIRCPLYISKAVGYTKQPNFINTAIRGETTLQPRELLDFVKTIEKQVGRIKRFRWGPREIDIDIIFYGDQIIDLPNLHIPHPRFKERDFVLKPLAIIDPNLIDPLSKLTINQLLSKLPKDELSILSEIKT